MVCPTCEGVGFVLFESMGIGFEEPTGFIRTKCETCGGGGEIMDEPITIKVKDSELVRVTRERDEALSVIRAIAHWQSDGRLNLPQDIARDYLVLIKAKISTKNPET